MRHAPRKTISQILRLLLKPLARFCISHGVRVQDLNDFTKSALLDAATNVIERDGNKATVSRLAAITGLQRRDVEKFSSKETELDDSRDLIRKVIGFWQSGEKFTTQAGAARVLTFGSESSEFSELVKTVSKDMNSATILFELERLGIVEKSPRGLKLKVESYSPRKDAEAGFRVVSDDLHDLIQSAQDNLFSEASPAQLHVRTNYDNIRADALPEIKQWLLKEGHSFHARTRDFISQYDQEINPKPSFNGETTQVTVTSFGRTGYKKDE